MSSLDPVLIAHMWTMGNEEDINNVDIERAFRVKAYSKENKRKKKLRPRKVVFELPSFADKARILKNSL